MPEEEKKEGYQLVEVPTKTALAVRTPEGEIWDINKAIVELLNKVEELKKVLQ